jgi:nucleotide-binding universal stress UspA family protein
MRPAPAPFTDILVPLDFSAAAERALRPALELARLTGVPLRVVQRAADDADAAASYLADVARRHAGVDIETLVVTGHSTPRAIFDRVGLDTLVCMSSHGHGLVRALTSVTEALLRMIDRPVLVVGPHVADTFAFTGRVAACIDGSPESERTLEPAGAWAAALHLPLWLVQVAMPTTPAEWATDGGVYESADLARLATRVPDVVGWDTYHSRHPARELAGRSGSASEPTALLVMATHARRGWDRLRLGSVTAATVHDAAVPVLVVPAGPPAPVDPVARAYEELGLARGGPRVRP